jgi:hypothetical protein
MHLISHTPSRQPLQMAPLLVVALHAKAESAEEPEHADDGDVQHGENAPLHALAEITSVPVQAEA